ncbi:winged helix DNA-binding protein [Pseudomonas sp. R2.Fl]|nr:winged helix DNA-binding protein [Pseudomonas sp. R2.Fl]
MDTRHIRAYFEANRRLMGEHKDIPVSVALTFLGVAIWESHADSRGEPMTLEDLAVKVGSSATTVSQHLRYLGDRYREDRPGLGLVDTEEYRPNRRKKTFHLTPKGRGLIRQLDMILRKAEQR